MKNWSGLLLCFVVSTALWLFFSVSQTYSQIINVPVLISSDIPGHSSASSREVTIAARCSANGFDLIQFNTNKEAVPVFIEASSLRQVDENAFILPQASVIKYSDRIFGDDVKVESVLSEDIMLNFPSEYCVKVPVVLSSALTYHRQYMSPEPASTNPDSILVYGTPEKVSNLDGVETEIVRAMDLRNSVHGNVKLKKPTGLRLSVDEVEYNIPVCRYVDVSVTKEIKAKGVPPGVDFMVLPFRADVTIKCYFPIEGNPTEEFDLYVDYKEYESSLSGKCRVRTSRVPEGIISYEIDPEFCSCIQNIQ